MLATSTPARPVKGAVLYLSAGNQTLAVTSRVPQFFALAANDDTLGGAGLADARENSQLLAGRGIATNFVSNPASPVHAGRVRTLGLTANTFTANHAQAICSLKSTTSAATARVSPISPCWDRAQAGAATLNAAFPAVGAFPLRAASDAALINALAPGNYTLQAGAAPIVNGGPAGQVATVSVAPNQTGSILVEVCEVP